MHLNYNRPYTINLDNLSKLLSFHTYFEVCLMLFLDNEPISQKTIGCLKFKMMEKSSFETNQKALRKHMIINSNFIKSSKAIPVPSQIPALYLR